MLGQHPHCEWISLDFLCLECSGGGSYDDQAETAKLQGGSESAELG